MACPYEQFGGYVDRSKVEGEHFVDNGLLPNIQKIAGDLKIPSPTIRAGRTEVAGTVILTYLPSVSVKWDFPKSSHCITVAYDKNKGMISVHYSPGAVLSLREDDRYLEISAVGDFWKESLSNKLSQIYHGLKSQE